MLFNTLTYGCFLLVSVLIYYALPSRFRWLFLLIASYVFYTAWRIEYAVLILLSTAIDYWAALEMEKRADKKKRKPFLYASLAVNLGLLMGFKYMGFLHESFLFLSENIGIDFSVAAPDILLPIGISFYTFQTLSYTIDVYRGKQKAERHFGRFALYVSFFPQLVSGPIERASNLLPQLKRKNTLDPENISQGLKLIIWGLFQKMVIADRLALYVDAVFQDPASFEGIQILGSVYAFSFQVLADFSGYTHIAIGSAMLFGICLSDNFDRPYWATSIRGFWRRWHITLTDWVRDYVYFSLGGNRRSKWRNFLNLYLVFLAIAIWHGTDVKLWLFGSLHFLYYVLEEWTYNWRLNTLKKWSLEKHVIFRKVIPLLVTFHLVSFTWVIWWTESWADCKLMFAQLCTWGNNSIYALDVLNNLPFALASLVVFALFLGMKWLHRKHSERNFLGGINSVWRWVLFYAMIIAILFFRPDSGGQTFIYFQF